MPFGTLWTRSSATPSDTTYARTAADTTKTAEARVIVHRSAAAASSLAPSPRR